MYVDYCQAQQGYTYKEALASWEQMCKGLHIGRVGTRGNLEILIALPSQLTAPEDGGINYEETPAPAQQAPREDDSEETQVAHMSTAGGELHQRSEELEAQKEGEDDDTLAEQGAGTTPVVIQRFGDVADDTTSDSSGCSGYSLIVPPGHPWYTDPQAQAQVSQIVAEVRAAAAREEETAQVAEGDPWQAFRR